MLNWSSSHLLNIVAGADIDKYHVNIRQLAIHVHLCHGTKESLNYQMENTIQYNHMYKINHVVQTVEGNNADWLV